MDFIFIGELVLSAIIVIYFFTTAQKASQKKSDIQKIKTFDCYKSKNFRNGSALYVGSAPILMIGVVLLGSGAPGYIFTYVGFSIAVFALFLCWYGNKLFEKVLEEVG